MYLAVGASGLAIGLLGGEALVVLWGRASRVVRVITVLLEFLGFIMTVRISIGDVRVV